MNPWNFNKNLEDKIEIVFNDLVVEPGFCNLSCKYCLSNQMPTWLLEDQPNSITKKLIYSEETELKHQLDSMFKNYNNIFDASILRISGGEIFLVKGIIDFLKANHENFDVVQIVTNGLLLNEENIKKLKEIPNCHLHISLDGHTVGLNNNRVKSHYQQETILKNLENSVKTGFPIEIGAVLSNTNTRNFTEFLDYLLKYNNQIIVFPFPLRGEAKERFHPDRESILEFSKIIENYSKYQNILLPFSYIEEVYKILKEDKRQLRCHIPKTMLQFFNDGNISPCPNGWASSLGNLIKDDSSEIKSKIGRDKIYSLFLQSRPRLSFCKECFTSLDIINLYIEGKISDEELASIPLYSGSKTQARLKYIKNKTYESL